MKLRIKRRLRLCLLLLGIAIIGLNVSAFLHARQMTQFVRGGQLTPSPEKLSVAQKLRVLLTGVRVPRPANNRTPADFGLAAETVTFIGAHKLEIEGWLMEQSESRGVVLLFHGYTGAKDSMLPAAKAFFELGYDTLVVDFHGSGGSAGNETSIGFHEAEDVAAAFAFAAERKSGQPILLYGVSMGAASVLRAIHEFKLEPAAAILESPFDRLLSTVKTRFAAMGLPSFPSAQLLVFWGGVQHGYNGFRFNPADYAASVRCPALVMGGDMDARATASQVRNVCAKLRGPHVLKAFPGLGHQSYLAARPDEWKSCVQEFLDLPAGQ